MGRLEIFALRDTGLEPFLYANAGTQRDGTPLTVLSMLARLGLDPWAESAHWVNLPRATAIDGLAACLGKTALFSEDAGDGRAEAARLIQLLPSRTQWQPAERPNRLRQKLTANAAPMILLCCVLALGMAYSVITMSRTPSETPPPGTAGAKVTTD